MIKKILLFICMTLLLGSLISAEHSLPTDLVDSDTGLMEGMGEWANSVTKGAFWTFMLLGFCVVLMLATMNYGVTRSFGYGGTAGLFGSITLVIIGWMPWATASFFIVVGAGSLVFMIKAR